MGIETIALIAGIAALTGTASGLFGGGGGGGQQQQAKPPAVTPLVQQEQRTETTARQRLAVLQGGTRRQTVLSLGPTGGLDDENVSRPQLLGAGRPRA